MKAVTVQGFWAWAIVHGSKRIENRNYAPSYRGPLAIVCGKSTDWDEMSRNYCEQLDVPLPGELPRGKILGIVRLVDCVKYGPDLHGDPWASGPVCWKLADVRPLAEPIAQRGYQTIFTLAPDVVAAIEKQLAAHDHQRAAV